MLHVSGRKLRFLALPLAFLLYLMASTTAFAQSSAFTYQGRLTDAANPADGIYDFQFKLFDALTAGAQMGGTLTNGSVQVTNGTFTVQLDFSPCASCFAGSARFLEIGVRPAGSLDPYTVLSPRQPVTSAPYAVRSASASTADTALNATQLGGVSVDGFIQNTTSQQTMTNFNIAGTGRATIFDATTHISINGVRMLSASGPFNNGTTILAASNTFVGESAGINTTPSATISDLTGRFNSFFGADAGKANTTGFSNSFFGVQAGKDNMTGSSNSFFGFNAGFLNTSGGANSFFGRGAGASNTGGGSNSFFGVDAGFSNAGGGFNSFFGVQAGGSNTGSENSFFGNGAGFLNTGSSNSFFGASAGDSSSSGTLNTLIGFLADMGAVNLQNATAIGAHALVGQSDSLVLGSIQGVNGCTAANNCNSVNVGIGTSTPAARLHIRTLSINSGENTAVFAAPNIGPNLSHLHFGTTGDWYIRSAASAGKVILQDSGGNVGIGTTALAAKLHVSGTGIIRARVNSNDNAGLALTLNDQPGWSVATVTGGHFQIFNDAIGQNVVWIDSATNRVGVGDTAPADRLHVGGELRVNACVKNSGGTAIAGACPSDLRFKRDITPFPQLLDKLVRLRPVNYYWRGADYPDRHFGAGPSYGLIAQEVEQVLPELVSEDEQGYKAVNYSKLPLLTVQAVKELKAENDALRQTVTRQGQQLKEQEERLRRLEAAMEAMHEAKK